MSGPAQLDFFGGSGPPTGLEKEADKVEWLLQTYPDTRADDNVLGLRYLQHFGKPPIPEAIIDKVLPWFRGNKRFETARRRRQEFHELEMYLPDDDVIEYRRQQARHGPVR